MNFPRKYRTILKRSAQIIGFVAAILCTTAFTVKFGTITSTSTAAFIFLIIVLLSAFFGNILVAFITSIVATLCFDYFYLPPIGTFNIASFSDWISLAAFLLTSVIISRLTASAAENKEKATMLDNSLIQLKEFGIWLLSIPGDQLTLSKTAEEALRIFSLQYCSIHVYGEGKWHHFTGAAATFDIFRQIENQINFYQDHNADLTEIVDENMLGVQYMKIGEGTAPPALLVVKTNTLSTNTISAIACMMGIRLMEIMKNRIL
jgi:two-component system sensor histidine kinase KdpD